MNFRDELKNIVNYEAGKPIELVVREFGIDKKDVIKLASNENPFGTSPKVKEAIRSIVDQMHRYPDDSFFELKDALAKKYSVESGNIIIGSGSDQIFEFITHALLNSGDKVAQNRVSFAMYAIYAAQVGAKMVICDSREHNLDLMLDLIKKENPKLVYICTPSNPAGDALDRDQIYSFLEQVDRDVMVVIDAAYMEYAAGRDKKKLVEPSDLIRKFPNTIYTGTFSKAYGLGGMRVGYGIADKTIINELGKMRAPFNITTLSLKAAIEALKDEEFLTKSIEHNFKEMTRYEQFCDEMGLNYIKSYTNFIAIEFPEGKSATEMANALLKEGVIIRDLKSYGINAIRVTIGLTSENDRFFERFKANWR